jgi:tyrosine-specific transport protein
MKINKITGGILLITGTCIGAGMLVLPVATASSGFLSSSCLLIVTWLAMLLTGLYVLEVNLWLPAGANFISMAKATLGKVGNVVAWITYLLLLYSILAAYLAAGSDIVAQAVKATSHITIQSWLAPLPWLIAGAVIIYTGVRYVVEFNRLLMLGLAVTYFMMVIMSSPHVELNYLTRGHPLFLFSALPVVLASFGYHVVIPSLRVYLQSDAQKLAKIIFWGTLIPLLVYLIWEFVIFGTIPIEGSHGLAAIYQSGRPATQLTQSLSELLHNAWIVKTAEFFIFFAIATSFLGMALSLFDFLCDGFSIPKTHKGKCLAAFITFIPPLSYALLFPEGFIMALSYAGVFVAILHGILPAFMLWAGRYKNMANRYHAPGGVVGIIFILVFSLLVIIAQITNLRG